MRRQVLHKLRLFAEFRRGRPEFRLVIAGLRGFNSAYLDALRQSLGLAGSVEFTGWIPREELYDLYARASAFVYPSTFEGFGLPVLEALAAGVPTACSRIEPLASMAAVRALRVFIQVLHRITGVRSARHSPRSLTEGPGAYKTG